MSLQEVQALEDRYLMRTYKRGAVDFVRGEGALLWDAEGREYLDFLAGISVCSLGHCHPAVVAAVTEQTERLMHVSNLFYTEPMTRLARRLSESSLGGRVFFCNSGTEANEVALKITRLTGRTKLVAAEGGFHGRTMGSLALTGQPAKRAPFEPLPGEVTFVPYGDTQALEAAVGDDTAAVFLEPIMGEGGVVVPPAGYLAAAREITTKHGALLVLDESHHAVAGTWAKITAAWPNAKILGVSATPERLDGVGLREAFDQLVIGPDVRELIDAGHLAPFRYLAPKTAIDLSGVRSLGGDFNSGDL